MDARINCPEARSHDVRPHRAPAIYARSRFMCAEIESLRIDLFSAIIGKRTHHLSAGRITRNDWLLGTPVVFFYRTENGGCPKIPRRDYFFEVKHESAQKITWNYPTVKTWLNNYLTVADVHKLYVYDFIFKKI